MEPGQIKVITIISIIYLFACEEIYLDTFDFKVFYPAIGFMIAYGGLTYLYSSKKIVRETLLWLFWILVMTEAFIAAGKAAETAGHSGRSNYYAQNSEVQEGLKYLEETDDGFFRVEMYNQFTVNDPLLYGYNGISQFASTANARANWFTKKMGMPSDPGANTFSYKPSTPALNGMFNVKYLISKHDAIPIPNDAYDVVFEAENISVLKNKHYLPVGYVVKPEIRDIDLNLISVFERQEMFYQLATGMQDKYFFIDIPVYEENYTNIQVSHKEGIRFHYTNIDETLMGNIQNTFKMPESGQYYLYMLNQNKEMILTVDGAEKIHDPRRGLIVDLGRLDKDKLVEVALK